MTAPAVIPKSGAALVEYSIGNPSAEEQMYLEFVNRARLNPVDEGYLLATNTTPALADAYDFFNVDLQRVVNEIAEYPPVQPLAFESRLIQAARGHSTYMFTRGLQEHDQTNPLNNSVLNDTAARVSGTGYPWNNLGESIFAFAESVLQGHAGFEVDWGDGDGGVQRPPGHRNNNHDPDFREIGIGVVLGTNRVVIPVITNLLGVVIPASTNNVGPQVVTFDFGSRTNLPPLVTGVAYYDLNTNGFYDIGEGLPGIRVEVPEGGSFAVTAGSGGYAAPAAVGTNSVRFLSGETEIATRTAVTTNATNVKRDLILPYVAPAVSGPAVASVEAPNFYQLGAVVGAQSYEWSQVRLTPFSAFEGVEDGGTNFVFSGPAAWNPARTNLQASGTRSFQLVHLNGENQALTYRPVLRPGTSATVKFKSYFGFTTINQVGLLEVSRDGGTTWQIAFGQRGRGTNQPATGGYLTNSVSLAAYAGADVKVRFHFFFENIEGAVFYAQTSPSFGWHLDDVEFTGFSTVSGAVTNSITSGRSFTFQPPATGSFELRGRPVIGGRAFPFSQSLAVMGQASAPPGGQIVIDSFHRADQGRLALDFTLRTGTPGSWRLETAAAVSGPWSVASGAVLTTNALGRYTFVHFPGDASLFYRVAVQ